MTPWRCVLQWYLTKADGRATDQCRQDNGTIRCPVTSDWSEFYSIDPRNFSGSATQKARVLGGECVAWNDNTHLDSSTLLGALFPACSSVAEVLWSPAELTAAGPTAGTYQRLLDHRCRLVARGIPASVPANGPGVGWSGDVGFCPEEFAADAAKTDDSQVQVGTMSSLVRPRYSCRTYSSVMIEDTELDRNASLPRSVERISFLFSLINSM